MKVQQSCYRRGVAQRVPGSCSQITWQWHRIVVRSALRTGHQTPGNAPGTHFCWRLSQPQSHSAIRRIMWMKNSNDTIWNWTSDLPIYSTAQCEVLSVLFLRGNEENHGRSWDNWSLGWFLNLDASQMWSDSAMHLITKQYISMSFSTTFITFAELNMDIMTLQTSSCYFL